MKYILGLLLILLVNNNIEASIPKCSDCTVYATGKDGTSWGWENDSFCRLPSKCNSKTTTKKSSLVKTKSTIINKKTTTTSTKEKDKSTTEKVTSTKKHTSITSKKTSTTEVTSEKKESTTKVSSTTVTSTVASPMQTDANGKLICNGCTVESTGGDGALWGWENEKSCIIDNAKCNITSDTKQVTNSTTTNNTTKQERGKDGILICSTCEYTRIEEDTTTWNKENGEDCRVIGSRCGFNKTPHPWCSGCVVTATGEDGALYGWESQASCLINEIDCGFVDKKNNSHVVTESSSAINEKYIGLYYVISTLLTLFIIRGF